MLVSTTSNPISQSSRKRKARSVSIDSDDESTEKVNDNVLIEFPTLSAMVDKASQRQKTESAVCYLMMFRTF